MAPAHGWYLHASSLGIWRAWRAWEHDPSQDKNLARGADGSPGRQRAPDELDELEAGDGEVDVQIRPRVLARGLHQLRRVLREQRRGAIAAPRHQVAAHRLPHA